MNRNSAVFLINLLQDVNILRPLILLAHSLGIPARMLVTTAFAKRDQSGLWQGELNEIAGASGALIETFETVSDAIVLLQDGGGIILAGSESNLEAHGITHGILSAAPQSYVTVTLQHGFECVGFLQSREHDIAHGREVVFSADTVCGWSDAAHLRSLAPSQRGKLVVSGPSALLQGPFRGSKSGRGMVCENLHSVRFSASGDFKADFMSVFGDFCASMAELDRTVTLRPHPGGQYVLKNNIRLPANVVMNNQPIYKVDLSRYAYGISAPSSILIDFLLAEIPTAVWSDAGGGMDTGNYAGLTRVSSKDDWVEFARQAEADPAPFLRQQKEFLLRSGLQTDPQTAHRVYADLMLAAMRRAEEQGTGAASLNARPAAAPEQPLRILYIANALVETLQICLMQPLSSLVDGGSIVTSLITEADIRQAGAEDDAAAISRLEDKLAAFDPDLLLFCRYSGPMAEVMTAWARRNGVAVMYHLDDDLLNVPRELGEAKFRSHNAPERLASCRHLLAESHLVYCSTAVLGGKLRSHGLKAPVISGALNASASVITPAALRPLRKVGYMGSSSHGADLAMVAPAIAAYLREFPEVTFEVFGAIPLPPELAELSGQVVQLEPVRGYQEFMQAFAAREWDAGLCPLLQTPFNLCKSNVKWLEYTSVGTAVIASAGTVYDDCCAGGCGILAGSGEEWLAALRRLTLDPELRHEQVRRAQMKLEQEFTRGRHTAQVLAAIGTAFANAGTSAPGWPPLEAQAAGTGWHFPD
jgi:glycosyltransferase involved in cell wall biosynthesis